MDRTRWIIFGLICIAIFGVLILNKKSNDIDVSKIDTSKVVTKKDPKIGDITDHVYGSSAKKVILIEYGDFQCPGCGSLHPSITPLTEHYKDQLTFVFRNFPLTTIHPNAFAAATAAEAAGLQGKFWEYHHKLYENQEEWSSLNTDERSKKFEDYAKELGLDITTYRKDLEKKSITQKIQRDQALGKKAGADSTPTLILDGVKLEQDSWNTKDKLEETIRTAIKESGQELPPVLNTAQ